MDNDVNKTVAVFSHNLKNGIDAANEVLSRRKYGEYLLPKELEDVTKMSIEMQPIPCRFYIEDGYLLVNTPIGNGHTRTHRIRVADGSYTLKTLDKELNKNIDKVEFDAIHPETKESYKEVLNIEINFYMEKDNTIHIETYGGINTQVMFSENICKILGIPYDWFNHSALGTLWERDKEIIHLYCDLVDSSKSILNGKQNCLLHTFKFDHFYRNPLQDSKSNIIPVGNHKFNSFKIWYSDSDYQVFNLFDHIEKVTFTFTFYHGKC